MRDCQKHQFTIVILSAIAVLATLVAPASTSAGPVAQIRAMMGAMNDELEAMGEPFRVGSVEYYTAWTEAGQIVYFNNRTKQMPTHFVPGDPRRGGRTNITWCSDLVDATANGLTQAETQAAISSAMGTWANVRCSNIPLVMVSDLGIDWGFAQWLLGFGGHFPPPIEYGRDIVHAGCLPGTFFDALGAPPTTIGVTITWYWNPPTDEDDNKKVDVAWREIYYNNAFSWGWGPDVPYPLIDMESVALHEAGHGLSQGHFGRFFRTEANDKLHFAPLAVMNAGYTGALQELTGTDLAGHCSIWAAWPYK